VGIRHGDEWARKKWERGLIQTQSGVELRLYVKCEGGGKSLREAWSYPLVVFFFFFCNHAFIVFRYKKPHAALAMERTKPIKSKTNNKRKLQHR